MKNSFGRKVATVATLGLMAAALVAGGSAANAAANKANGACTKAGAKATIGLSLIHISEPTRPY